MAKVEGKHLVFKTSLARINTRLLIDNDSEAELIDKSFAYSNKISTFQLKKPIQLMLGNGKMVQRLTKGCLVNVEIGDHKDQILCYLAKLDVYTIILGNGWLQMHNPAIDWKDCTMKFNSANCIEKKYLLNGKPCIEFAMGCKLKHEIGLNKPTAGGNIDIQQVNVKHFFQIARKKDHKGYLWIPRVSTNDCTKECCAGVVSSTRKWCANITSCVAQEDYEKFMKEKPEYTRKKLLEKVPKKYHNMINVFMKRNADMLPKHQDEDHSIQLEEGKNPPFVQNYRPLSDQENKAMIKYIQKYLEKGFI